MSVHPSQKIGNADRNWKDLIVRVNLRSRLKINFVWNGYSRAETFVPRYMPSDVGEWTNNINANKGHGVGKDSGFRRSRPALRELSANSAQVLLMPLSLRERLTMLMPPSVFYRQRIAQEARTGEPELAVLAELVPRGGIAVDVGALLPENGLDGHSRIS